MTASQPIVPFIPETAPFSTEQRAWLNGFLAGNFAKQPLPAGVTGAEPQGKTPAIPVTIVWGSQTGNAEQLAKQAKKHLAARGAEVNVFDLAEYPCEQLAEEKHLLVITSTYGEGDPPDNAEGFHRFLLSEKAPRLEQTRFAVLALGDTNYPDFCQTGKDFDQRFEALGAQRLHDRIDCDIDFEDPFEGWLQALEGKLAELSGTPETPRLAETDNAEPEKPTYSKKNPFPAPLITNRALTSKESCKDTRHFEFSLQGSGLTYEAGDALGVRPTNNPESVHALAEAAGFALDTPVGSAEEATLEEVLTHTYDVSKLTLGFLQDAALASGNEELQKLVTAAEDDRAVFQDYAWGRELLDVMQEFQLSWSSVEAFLACLKKLTPRLYSISSSPKAHPDEVHLTVGVVRYESHGRSRAGICSSYLAGLAADSPVGVYIQPNKHFKPPQDPAVPMIMVGPGTGIAPFRAFLEEREATGASGRNWLFFGEQKAASDFLYREQIEGWQKSGLLTEFEAAFSRDQAQKIYVQDRMRSRAKDLARWLEEGAHFYVCGDASRMAKDVDTALREIVATEVTGGDAVAASDYVDQLAKAKRYLRDVY